MIKVTPLIRVFEYKGTTFPDPNPNSSPDEVRNILSAGHPALATAAIDGPEEKDGKQTYKFITSVGTKG